MAEQSPDVIIIGGGVLGCSVAYHLCCRSDLRVALVERGTVGMQTTSLAASLITRGKPKRPLIDLVLHTFDAIEALEDPLGESLDFNAVGSLHVCQSEDSAAVLTRQAALLREVGDKPEILDIRAARELAPWLNLDDAHLLQYNPKDGFIDPYRLASAYLRAAKSTGRLEVHQGCEVREITTECARMGR